MAGNPISFLSDYGLDDEFVGIVHRVIAALAPGVTVIDVTHSVPPHDVRAGALALWRAAPWLAPGVILAVVDPGVGTDRRPIALEVADARCSLVGPDNGLLLPAALALGTVSEATRLDPARVPPAHRRGTHGGPLGATFDGRDLFAPAAAVLATGRARVVDLGEPVDPAGLEGRDLVPRPSRLGPGPVVEADVLWVDRYGNVQLSARAADIDRLGPHLEVSSGERRWSVLRVHAFGDLGPGEMGLVTDSYGLLALCMYRASAAGVTGLRAGDPLQVHGG